MKRLFFSTSITGLLLAMLLAVINPAAIKATRDSTREMPSVMAAGAEVPSAQPTPEQPFGSSDESLPAQPIGENTAPVADPAPKSGKYAFGNPAGCARSAPADSASAAMLAGVQADLGDSVDLGERRGTYIWNGPRRAMLDVRKDPFVFEFEFNEFQPSQTYRADRVATIFLIHGFTVWFRRYNGSFYLLAVPMTPGVLESPWADYVTSYWKPGGMPADESVYPVMKKLPCRWVVDSGYVDAETLKAMFPLDWHTPDYLTAGRKYLAADCREANRISREEIGYWDATSMCGPLAWTIMRDSGGFPYEIGSWSEGPRAFIGANPRWSGQPWATFDPRTFDLTQISTPMPGHDFQSEGNLYPGDVIYSFTSLYREPDSQTYDHIFLVAGIDGNGARLTISNMVQNYPGHDCFIREVVLYTPGDRHAGAINHEWNGFGYGITGTTGFDIFRWKWITYHLGRQSIPYTVRWGDTIETIAFDWKISPESLLTEGGWSTDAQLVPGQIVHLPDPDPYRANILSRDADQ